MTNPGNPDSQPENDGDLGTPDSQQRTVPWRIIVLGAVALILAVIIGTQVLGVLYVIAFPPAPPLPGDVTLMSHTSTDYGVDEWLYDSRQSACDVLNFYIINSAGQCRMAPFQCADTRTDNPDVTGSNTPGQNIARCVAESKVSIFAMRWQAIIATGPTSDVPTEFRLIREIFWTGEAPPIQNLNQP